MPFHIMVEIVIFSIGFFVVFGIPLTTALFARRMGRRPWLWFLIGILLPVIATFVIFLLPDLSDSESQK
jgi:MFS family permease